MWDAERVWCSRGVRTEVDLSSGRTANTLEIDKADARTRTGDPFITSEVLYQLSYVGAADRV
jgi:hypothetical protein